MNHLAHIFLSGEDSGLILGNFSGDFVKGHDWKNYPADIQKGMLLHRRIDDFTDHHPLVKEAKKLFLPDYHPYTGILTDIFFDGVLAMNFVFWSGRDLDSFASGFYALARERINELPEYARHVLEYMERDNWLCRYKSTEGLEATLRGMTKRIGSKVALDKACSIFIENTVFFDTCFHDFFTELIIFTRQEILHFSHDFSA